MVVSLDLEFASWIEERIRDSITIFTRFKIWLRRVVLFS